MAVVRSVLLAAHSPGILTFSPMPGNVTLCDPIIRLTEHQRICHDPWSNRRIYGKFLVMIISDEEDYYYSKYPKIYFMNLRVLLWFHLCFESEFLCVALPVLELNL